MSDTSQTTPQYADVVALPSFKRAWDEWRSKNEFDGLPDLQRAAMRIGFVAGWRAKESQNVGS